MFFNYHPPCLPSLRCVFIVGEVQYYGNFGGLYETTNTKRRVPFRHSLSFIGQSHIALRPLRCQPDLRRTPIRLVACCRISIYKFLKKILLEKIILKKKSLKLRDIFFHFRSISKLIKYLIFIK